MQCVAPGAADACTCTTCISICWVGASRLEAAHLFHALSPLLLQNVQRANLTRWFLSFLVGVYVAVIAVVVAICITYISKLKFMAIYSRILPLFVQRCSPSSSHSVRCKYSARATLC